MVTQSEAALEKCLIDKLVDGGYNRVKIKDEDELRMNLKTQLEKFNNIKLDDDEFNRILIHLESGTVFDKSKKLRDRYELRHDDGTVSYIKFLNKKNWCKNCFQVTNQVTMKGRHENRYDVTILINGLPLVQIELKKRGIELKRAFNQVLRYHKHSFKGLFQYVQIFVISNGVNTKYYANNKALSFKYTFFWKDKDNRNISNLKEFAETFLEKCHVSKMITKYIVLNETDKALLVFRSYQYYAVEAILDKALNTKKNGYVWHTTGSGKTLTSFKVSQILAQEANIDKIIFVVDRKDLDYQTITEFDKFSPNSVDGTENTYSLINQLLGQDKLIITTIQKLNRAVVRHDRGIGSVKDKKVILMFDECHRSQFGEMHKNITGFFTNLQYFGFTGTPIFSVNANNTRTTKDIFGERLHTYVIKDAIKDENVLGFSVEYLGKYTNKTTLDIDVEAIDTKEVMESDDRLGKIADYIVANHNRKTYNKEFNGIFAVSSIDVLTKYYEIFKSKDHDLKIATIFSFDPNEEGSDEHSMDKLGRYMSDYNEMYGTNFSTETFTEYYKDISKKSKDKQIDLLLVVNMFLTGFDSKYLNTLYVDKNLQYHGLLQAYSRTNRILDEKKKHGNIVCFRNLKEATDKSIRLYSDENPSETVLMKSYEGYANDFKHVLDEEFRKITTDVSDIDDLPSDVEEKKFVKIFRELLRLLTRLRVFTEFTYDDLGIDEQTFADYQSKYLDLYEKVNDNTDPERTSILEDIDFEVELIRRDDINVAYILTLLKELDPQSKSFDKDKEFILDTMKKSRELRSKIDLIERFIGENIPHIANKDKIEENFEIFIDREKTKAVTRLIETENLKTDVASDIIAEYEFSGKMRNELIKGSFLEKLGLKDRRLKLQSIKEKIIKLVEKFTW